jgi:hypothetical protein
MAPSRVWPSGWLERVSLLRRTINHCARTPENQSGFGQWFRAVRDGIYVKAGNPA